MGAPPQVNVSLRLSTVVVLTGLGLVGSLLAVRGASGSPGITYIGTNGPDRHRGTPGSDRLYGRGGNDKLWGLEGKDLLVGGRGSDRLLAGPGADKVQAQDGAKDFVNCGPGKDVAVIDNVDVVRSCETVRRPSAKTGSLRHPIPIGAPAALGDGWRLRVVKATPNATERILAYDSSNNPPAEGFQFYMVEVSALRTGRKAGRFHAGFRLRAVAPKSVNKNEYTTFKNSCGLLPDPDLEIDDPKVFHKGRARGNVCWEVRKRDAKHLVMYNNGTGHSKVVYFRLK